MPEPPLVHTTPAPASAKGSFACAVAANIRECTGLLERAEPPPLPPVVKRERTSFACVSFSLCLLLRLMAW